MAINILTEPQDPPIDGDYTLDQAIQHAAEVPQLSILTGWEETSSAPSGKQGAFIRHVANTFQIQGSDESISGSPASGINYIIATETSGVITLAWATDISSYSYNPAYGGIYDSSGNQALRDVCYLDGTDYYRGMASGEDFNVVKLADGKILTSGNLDINGSMTVGDTLYITGTKTTGGSTVSGDGNSELLPMGLLTVFYTEIEGDGGSLLQYIDGTWYIVAQLGNSTSVRQRGITIVSDGTDTKIQTYASDASITYKWVKF